MSETTTGGQGRAVETYTFGRARPTGAGRVWRYVAADADVVIAGIVYRAAAITRSAIRRGDDGPKATVDVETTLDLPLVQAWLAESSGRPDAPTSLVIQRATVATPGDGSTPATAADVSTLFLGTVSGLACSGAVARLTGLSLAAAWDRQVPTASIQRMCPHTLYDARCGLDRADFQWTGTISDRSTSRTGALLHLTMDAGTGPGIDATYFHGGTCDATPTSGADAGKVVASSGIVTATISWPVVSVALLRDDDAFTVGATVTLTAGCARTIAICRSRFANGPRFGGFPWLPNKDPLVTNFT